MSTTFGTTFDLGRKGVEIATADIGQGVCLIAANFASLDMEAECLDHVEVVMSTWDARRVATALLQAADAADDAERCAR